MGWLPLLTSISSTAGVHFVMSDSLPEPNCSLKCHVASFSPRKSSIFITLPVQTPPPPVLLVYGWVFPLQGDPGRR